MILKSNASFLDDMFEIYGLVAFTNAIQIDMTPTSKRESWIERVGKESGWRVVKDQHESLVATKSKLVHAAPHKIDHFECRLVAHINEDEKCADA